MPGPGNAMEIFKLLNKSNCRKCNQPTCLAFAAAVFKGQQPLGDCPYLDEAVVQRYDHSPRQQTLQEQELEETLEELKSRVAGIDLAAAATRLGGRFENGRLRIRCLGKAFTIDRDGTITSDIHVHAWVVVPLLNYVLYGRGVAPVGRWVPLRELKNGPAWLPLFSQRCEKPLKMLADRHTALFEDLIRLFSGRQVSNHYESDISLVLQPLPKIPILICYWSPDEGLESDLNLFFDATAEENLPIESLYGLVAGLVRMFEKIFLRHG